MRDLQADRLQATHSAVIEAGVHRYLLTLLILLLPVQFETPLGIRLAPSDVILLLMLATGGWWMTTYRRDWTAWHALLLLTFSLSLMNSTMREGSLTTYAVVSKFVGIMLLSLLFLVVVQYARSYMAIWRLTRMLVYAAVIQAAISLPLYLIGFAYLPLRVPRISGFLLDPNAYGGFMIVGLCLHFATVNTSSRFFSKRWAWLVTLLLMANLFLTFSRSAWIGFVLACIAAPLANRRCWRHVVGPLVVGALTILIFFQAYFTTQLQPLIVRPTQITARISILGAAIDAFASHPLFGIGLGSYIRENQVEVHNTFFWILAEMGTIGAVVYTGFVVAFFTRGWRALKRAVPEFRGLIGGLLVAHLAMIGFSVGIEALYQRYWWVVMALLSSAYTVATKAQRPGER